MSIWNENENGISSKRFLIETILIFVILLILAIPQWFAVTYFAKEHMLYTIIAFFVAYLLMITLYLVEPIEYAHPWNYIIVTVCYELLTLGCSTFVQDWHILYTVVSICFALGLTIIGLGVCFPLIWFSKYPNPVKTATFVSMCFALVYCTMNMKLIKEWLFWVDFAVAIFIFSAMIRLISHVMITDENFEKLIVDDIMVTAFKLYINFCLIFIGCAIAVDCIRLNTDWIVKE